MNLLDWLLVVALVAFAFAGWYRGFIAGLMSFAGFLGGGLLAAFILPGILETVIATPWLRVVVLVGAILAAALAGQFTASMIGARIRGSIPWRPARVVDNVAGAALNVLALAIVAWIVATAAVYLPTTTVADQVTGSKVLVALDSIVPPGARNAFGSLRNLVGASDVPRIFSGLAQSSGPPVAAPDPKAVTAAVDRARTAVVQVYGEAPGCQITVRGSGFSVGAEKVLTNAHVVAGVRDLRVRTHLGDPGLPARAVYFDPAMDVAILDVPGLRGRALALAPDDAGSGADAVIAGYPEGGSYRVVPARLRAAITAVGDDIYGSSGVVRDVYAFRGQVVHGNSGGPLLRPDGLVLGMVFGADEQDPDIGYAIRSSALAGPIAASLRAGSPVDTGDCHVRE